MLFHVPPNPLFLRLRRAKNAKRAEIYERLFPDQLHPAPSPAPVLPTSGSASTSGSSAAGAASSSTAADPASASASVAATASTGGGGALPQGDAQRNGDAAGENVDPRTTAAVTSGPSAIGESASSEPAGVDATQKDQQAPVSTAASASLCALTTAQLGAPYSRYCTVQYMYSSSLLVLECCRMSASLRQVQRALTRQQTINRLIGRYPSALVEIRFDEL